MLCYHEPTVVLPVGHTGHSFPYDQTPVQVLADSSIPEVYDLYQELKPGLTEKYLMIKDISRLEIHYTDVYGVYHIERYDVMDSGMKKINEQKYSKTFLAEDSMQIDDADVITIAENIRNVFGIEVPTNR